MSAFPSNRCTLSDNTIISDNGSCMYDYCNASVTEFYPPPIEQEGGTEELNSMYCK